MEISGETVKFGRRSGSSRQSPVQEDRLENEGQRSRDNVAVLSKGDWDRIQTQLSRTSQEAERIRKLKLEKEELHQRSKDMVKNWSNTIAGQRLKKLEARKIREEKEEKERVQIDIEEAKFQAEKRKEAIEKAKTLQYYQTDRVKGFHGALLLTEVLKEREAQIELQKAKEEHLKNKDKHLLEKYQRDLEAGILEDHNKALKALTAQREVSEFQKRQIQEHIKVETDAKMKDIKEGQELKHQLEVYNAEKARIEDIRRAEKLDLMRAHKQTVSDRDLIRAAERQKEEEEEDEIRIFAKAKKKMTQLRKEREQELWQKKQDHLYSMVEKLDSQLKQAKDDEDDRIARAVAEKEAKIQKETQEKEKAFAETLTETAKHRAEQMKRMQDEKRAERKKEFEALRLKEEADALFFAKQIEKENKRKEAMKALQKVHVQQVEECQAIEKANRKEQLAMDQKNLDLLAVEEQQFQEYATKVIDHCKKGGRNVYPLVKAAREGHGGGQGPVFEGKGGIRPSYLVQDKSAVELPHYQKGSTEEIKSLHVGQSANTRNRLGFVW
ncbi:coiled-coil domain-containing protein 173-like [Anneissia japonica]|uniref:coiled-coil domain-containing protein 173-like n=1 Tax=Anneissia japonica TaxID=1529436 RepID=UPI001425B17F|nr:coiled-coil domain-containing protein 173-like [Anneissia japonica]